MTDTTPTDEQAERHLDTERNKILNRALSDLESIINDHDPEVDVSITNGVWDRLDKMAVEIEARAALSAMQPSPAKWQPSDGDKRCKECGADNPCWFAPNKVWNLLVGGPDATEDPGGVLCPNCFMKRDDIVWEVRPKDQPSPAELTTAQKIAADLRSGEFRGAQPSPAKPLHTEARENIVDEIESIICETHDIDVLDIDYAENIVSWLERHHPVALRAIEGDQTDV